MLKIEVDEPKHVVIVEPQDKLSRLDFKELGAKVDPLIKKWGNINGVVIHSKRFVGWKNIAALLSQVQFVKQHKNDVKRIAFATDSPMGMIAKKLASHFTQAKVAKFKYNELEKAVDWAALK